MLRFLYALKTKNKVIGSRENYNKPIITLRAVIAYSMAAPVPLCLSC